MDQSSLFINIALLLIAGGLIALSFLVLNKNKIAVGISTGIIVVLTVCAMSIAGRFTGKADSNYAELHSSKVSKDSSDLEETNPQAEGNQSSLEERTKEKLDHRKEENDSQKDQFNSL